MEKSFLTPSIRKKILKSSVVSFDVFDTLLLRPYIRPTDLFLHIEKAYNCPFFRDCRIAAEIAAREHSTAPDVTLDEIYEQIDNNFKHLKPTELDWERMVLRANPQMLDVFNFAKQNDKRIIIASDMYLPSKFIADVLRKNGFDGYEKLYVSGECGVTKSRGTMFDYIVQDTGVAPKQILHIGDNRNSDYKKPLKHGLNAVWYQGPIRKFIKTNARIAKFHDKTREDLGASILIAMLAYRNLTTDDDNYWHNLGYEYGGPVIYGYTRWIEQVARQNGIKHLLFVARDGYTLQRVFNTFNNDIKNSYIYAPRFLNLICRLDYAKRDINQSKAIIDYFATKDKKIANLLKNTELHTWSDYHEFIQNNAKMFIPLTEQESKQYEKYIAKHVKKSDFVGIVDTITSRFSSQKLLEYGVKSHVLGLYWSIQKGPFEGVFTYKEFIHNDGNVKYTFTKRWDFMEFLMTAPELPIKSLSKDGTPIYDPNPTEAEVFRKQTYMNISDGAVDFTKEVNALFNNNKIFLKPMTIICWVNCFVDLPKRIDYKYMAQVKHAYDAAHNRYAPLFSTNINIIELITHPYKAIKISRHTLWKTRLQTILTCISSPLKIHIHGIQVFRILLLPKLKHRYFAISLKPGRKYLYEISIGKPRRI